MAQWQCLYFRPILLAACSFIKPIIYFLKWFMIGCYYNELKSRNATWSWWAKNKWLKSRWAGYLGYVQCWEQKSERCAEAKKQNHSIVRDMGAGRWLSWEANGNRSSLQQQQKGNAPHIPKGMDKFVGNLKYIHCGFCWVHRRNKSPHFIHI